MKQTYSKNFSFFLDNQIVLWTTNGGKQNTFSSRLNGESFLVIHGVLSDNEIKEACRKIHKTLIKRRNNHGESR